MLPSPNKTTPREQLAADWAAVDPRTPEQIAAFYRTADLEADLQVFHAMPMRRRWTELVADVARETAPSVVVDLGCGLGQDLEAVRAVAPDAVLVGVDPNAACRRRIVEAGMVASGDAALAPIESADLLVCIDVLEHVVDPEAWLGAILERTKLGALVVESAATHDIGTPLHLRANRGWRSGRVLETYGFERTFEAGRLRVWQRMAPSPRVQHAALALCAYRGVSVPTFRSVVNLVRADAAGQWRVLVAGEAGIARARSQVASWWWTDTADDVMLMVDDDISFVAADAEKLVGLCRSGYDVICAAYPTRDGSHLALRGHDEVIAFGPDRDPVPVVCAATGFLAFHRRVLDAIAPTLPVVNANLEAHFRAFFDFRTVPNEATGGHEWLSEDYDFSEKAKAAGFRIWLDPSILLGHLASVELTVQTMGAFRELGR